MLLVWELPAAWRPAAGSPHPVSNRLHEFVIDHRSTPYGRRSLSKSATPNPIKTVAWGRSAGPPEICQTSATQRLRQPIQLLCHLGVDLVRLHLGSQQVEIPLGRGLAHILKQRDEELVARLHAYE